MPIFLRRGWFRYSKLGRKRKNKQVWRRPSGRDNKMREKRRGYPSVVSIGYGTKKQEKGLIQGKVPVKINAIKDLEKMKKEGIGVLGKLGKKKKLEIAKLAEKKGIKFSNLNSKKLIRKELRNKKMDGIKDGLR
ncbi:MAG: eL32 family ribosomal protein [archaeon]